MPTKHIDTASWSTVESMTIKAIELSGSLVKEVDVIRLLIEKGAKAVTEEELRDINGFTPRYGVLSWGMDGSIRDFGTITPEEYAAYLNANQPVMTGVYGQTAVGKSTFKERLFKCLPDDLASKIIATDENDGRISEATRHDLFKSFFEEAKSVMFVEHAFNCSSMITKFVGAMATCEINFLFVGEVGEGRKAKMEKVSQVMRNSPTFTYVGNSKEEL